MDRPLVALITDFGSSEYVAFMKATIWRECADCRVVDVYHDVHHGAVIQGAHMLIKSLYDIPEAVHLVVVDPGVGTERRAVVVLADDVRLVGPDNGLLEPAVRGASSIEVRDIDFPENGASPVFHGRDIFAPAAARLARGDDLDSFSRPGLPLLAQPAYGYDRFGDRIVTRVSHIDVFGNVQTPIDALSVVDIIDARGDILVWIADKAHPARRVQTYGDLPPGELGVLVSSSGHVEVAQRDGPAAMVLEARIGDEIAIDGE
jgi:S-adenosylmethionine hydrolase